MEGCQITKGGHMPEQGPHINNAESYIELVFPKKLFVVTNQVVYQETGIQLVGMDMAPDDARVRAIDAVADTLGTMIGGIAVDHAAVDEYNMYATATTGVIPHHLDHLLGSVNEIYEEAQQRGAVDVTVSVLRRSVPDYVWGRPGQPVQVVRFGIEGIMGDVPEL